jgi:hypothetical protein
MNRSPGARGQPGQEKVFAVAQAQGSAARTGPLRALFRWHLPWYLELALVAVLLWGMDAVTGFRADARVAGLANATVVRAISRDLGGHVMLIMNGWLAEHAWLAAAAASYYIVLHGLITGVVGIALLRARPPRFALHRNALILATAIGTAVFWLYPVAPPRMLPGFHDIASDTVPFFASLLDSKAAGMFAALPSLHVIWAVWAAIAIQAIVRRRLWRAIVWVYPAATVADVMATGNHYLLDVLAGPVVVLLAYATAAGAAAAVRAWRRSLADRRRRISPAQTAPPPPVPAQTAAAWIAAAWIAAAWGVYPAGLAESGKPGRSGGRANRPEPVHNADPGLPSEAIHQTARLQAVRSRHELTGSGFHSGGVLGRYLRVWPHGFAVG